VKIQRAELLTSCPARATFPPAGPPEIAFLGRSNVGKSSLLNRLVQRRQLARTSSTPGKTRLIHFFDVRVAQQDLWLVDLPGYGYAKVSKKERAQWQRLIEDYLEGRPTLRLALLLQDLRRDLSEDETLLLEWLAERSVPALLAVTKIDKLKPMRRKQQLKQLRAQVPEGVECLATSSQTGEGIELLWRRMLEAAAGARPAF